MAGTVPTTESARATTTRELATAGRARRGPLLPILHAVMAEHGWVSDEDIAVIADVLNLSRADVHGVVSFYHDFRRTPPPAHRVQVCRGEACQAVGAQALYAAAQARFPAGGDVEVGEVFCLGNCALGPSAVLDGTLVGRLTLERLDTAAAGWTGMGPRRGPRRHHVSGLRGRGGAGFPTGIKWPRPCSRGRPLPHGRPQKYVVCNADEGDSGTFADRMLMEGDPFTLIEGMTIAGIAVGATEGYVYIRSEYPDAIATMRRAIDVARRRGWLGRTSSAPRASPSTWTCASAPAPTSAARRPRCSTASRASAASCAPSRRCPRSQGLFGRRRSSTTCSRSRRAR
jgi:formate dehydrogenase subunit gamma